MNFASSSTWKSNSLEAHSQYRWITAYTFHRMEDSKDPFTLTIFNTLGFGDTEGLEWNKEVSMQIKEFFSLPGRMASIIWMVYLSLLLHD